MTLLRRYLRLWRGRRLERDMEEEMRLHVQLETEELERSGVAPPEARRLALLSMWEFSYKLICLLLIIMVSRATTEKALIFGVLQIH